MMKTSHIFLIGLLVLALITSHAVIDGQWQGDVTTLFLSTNVLLEKLNNHSLSLADFGVALSLIPTMVVAILAGGLLGVCSTLLQTLTKNPLASDSTLAVGGGAQMALLITTIFLPSFGLYGNFWVGFLGALASIGLVFLLSAPSRFSPVVMVLSGLMVNIVLGAVANVLILQYAQYGLGVLLWGSGVLTQSGFTKSLILLATLFVLTIAIAPVYKAMSVMSLDDERAKSLGVSVGKIRLYVTVLVSGVLSIIVGNLGLIGFVGLMGATLANAMPVHRLWQKLLASFVFGALTLWITSNLTTLFLANTGIGAGAMTALLGTPLMIYWLFRLPKQKDESFAIAMDFDKTARPYLLVMALLLLMMIALWFAPKVVNDGTMMQIVWAWAGIDDGWLISEYRLPRTLTAISAGVMLSVAGVVLQSMSNNPMASPEVLGISSSTAMGVVAGFVILPMMGITPTMSTLFGFGLAGAALSLAFILWLSGRVASSALLLTGVAVSALVGVLMSIIKVSGSPQLTTVLSFFSGSSYYANPSTAYAYAGVAMAGLIMAVLYAKPLGLLGFGRGIAQGRGLDVTWTNGVLLGLVALLSVTATFATGVLSFVGLMTPHLAMMMGARTLQQRLLVSALLGACLLVVADWVGRYVIFPYEIPAGTIASLVGGVYFVGLMRKFR